MRARRPRVSRAPPASSSCTQAASPKRRQAEHPGRPGARFASHAQGVRSMCSGSRAFQAAASAGPAAAAAAAAAAGSSSGATPRLTLHHLSWPCAPLLPAPLPSPQRARCAARSRP